MVQKKPFYAVDIFAVVSPGQKRHRLERRAQLCGVYRSRGMKDFLEAAIKEPKDRIHNKDDHRFISLRP